MIARLADAVADRVPMGGWRVLSAVAAAGIVWMGNRPREQLDAVAGLPSGFDKVMHFTAFAVLATCLWRGIYPRLASRPPAVRHGWLVVIGVAMATGIIDELMQAHTPGRSSDWRDVAADTLGAAWVCAVGLWMRHRAAARSSHSS